MAVTNVYSVAGHGGNIILGSQDAGPRVYRNGQWQLVVAPGGFWSGEGATVAASTIDPNVLYGSRTYLDLFRSSDGGVTGASINGTLPFGSANARALAPFVLDPSKQRRMYAGAKQLWRSNDVDTGNAPAWTAVSGVVRWSLCGATYEPPIIAIAVAPSNPDVAWYAVDNCIGSILKSTNATQASPTFTEVFTTGSFSLKNSILVDAADPNTVWIAVGPPALYKTTDGGANWTPVAGFPNTLVRAMTQHPLRPSYLYAGTNAGLFASSDGGATWSSSNEFPADVEVRSLSWNSTKELLVGTFGRGVWKTTIDAGAPARQDFNSDARSDILYRNAGSGEVHRLLMGGGFTVQQGESVYVEPNTAWTIAGDADFDGDGYADLLWRNSATGQVFLQPFAPGGRPNVGAMVVTEPDPAWKIVFTPDLDGDGRADLLWWNSSTGQVYAMLMNGTTIAAQGPVFTEPNLSWRIAAVGDFTAGGKQNQLVYHNTSTGEVYLMTVTYSGGVFSQAGTVIYRAPSTAWRILAAADFNGDRKSDLLWRNEATGEVYIMLMDGEAVLSQGVVYREPNPAWKIVAWGDYNGDSFADLLWRNETTGQVFLTYMHSLSVTSASTVYSEPNTGWRILGGLEYLTASGTY